MEDQMKEMNELRGNPKTIRLGGKDITIKRLNLKNQMHVCEMFMAVTDSGLASTMETMGQVVRIAAGMDKDTFEETVQLHEIPEAFKVIWEQNEFSFLLQKVGSLKGLIPQVQ